jgi:hypothetical protein
MSTGWHVTAGDIVKWTETDSRQAQETLPLLVKRLVFASVSPSLISFSLRRQRTRQRMGWHSQNRCGNGVCSCRRLCVGT